MRPIEISIHREISSRLYHSFITWSYTMGFAISDALSTMAIRHIEQAASAFKVAHKNAKSRKSKFRPNEIKKINPGKSMFGENFSITFSQLCQ